MKMIFDQAIAIAKDLSLKDAYGDLCLLKSRMEQSNKDIVIPLVGEFSSGKTSLVNALTDAKQLEVASRPVTSTIFEVRFGYNHCYAEVINDNGEVERVEENIAGLRNSTLADVPLVRVYDTSTRVQSGVVLVDTPGLSSNDPKHKIALINYLPQADAIFLVSDVNQQITRSLLDFIGNTKIAGRPMYLILTMCDNKTYSEVEAAKEYIRHNLSLPIEKMITVSSKESNLQELYDLFADIEKVKNDIVTKAIVSRTKKVITNIIAHIDELLNSTKSDSELDAKIRGMQNELNRLNRNIDNLINDASSAISAKKDECLRKFKDNVFTRLDDIVRTQGRDCDEAVYTAVNSIAFTALQQYKRDVQQLITSMARERQNSLSEVPLQSLESLDMSDLVFNPISYGLNLAELGHQYDKTIGTTVKVVGAAAVIAGGTVALAGSAIAKGGAKLAGKAIDVADTATDAASIYSNITTRKHIQQTLEYGKVLQSGMSKVDEWNVEAGKKFTKQNRGIIETGVSWITDKAWGKPQRRRAVNSYIDDTLVPEFSAQVENARASIVSIIKQLLHDEAQSKVSTLEASLNSLKQERVSAKEQYQKRIEQLKEYKSVLINIK